MPLMASVGVMRNLFMQSKSRQKPTRMPYSCHAQLGRSGISGWPMGGGSTVRGIGRAIVVDQLALEAALRAVAEHIERGAAQALHLREHAHGAQHPRAVRALLRLARRGMGLRPERRREVQVQAIVALELRLDAPEE